MSDIETKLLERVAALESELSGKRKDDGKPAFDQRRATLDPLSYFKELGMDVEHMTRHFVASAMGKDCPPQLAAMVQTGPQLLATSNLEKLVNSLAESVSRIVEKDKEREMVASVKNTTVDPSKYPTLAAAIKTDSSLLDNEIRSLGKVADPSKAYEIIEAKLAPYAKAFGFVASKQPPTAPSENKEQSKLGTITTDTSSDFKSANQGLAGTEVPPLIPDATGVMTEDMNEKLKNAVLKKYNL